MDVILNLDQPIKKDSKMIDYLKAKGTVNITLKDKDGNIVEKFTNHNLVVKTGRSELIKRIAGTGTLTAVTQCGVGSGGANVGTPLTPIAPLDGDTALYSLVLKKSIGSVVVNTAGTTPQVTFTTIFTGTEVNSNVSECGLYFNDGSTLFARYTFATVALLSSSGFSMEIDWTIQF